MAALLATLSSFRRLSILFWTESLEGWTFSAVLSSSPLIFYPLINCSGENLILNFWNWFLLFQFFISASILSFLSPHVPSRGVSFSSRFPSFQCCGWGGMGVGVGVGANSSRSRVSYFDPCLLWFSESFQKSVCFPSIYSAFLVELLRVVGFTDFLNFSSLGIYS